MGLDRSRIVYLGDSVTIDVEAALRRRVASRAARPLRRSRRRTVRADPRGRRPPLVNACDLLFRSACNCYKVGTLPPMKKLLALSAVGVLALAACGDDDDDGGSDTTDVEVVATEEVTEESIVTEESDVVTETAVESVVEVTDTTTEESSRRGHRLSVAGSHRRPPPERATSLRLAAAVACSRSAQRTSVEVEQGLGDRQTRVRVRRRRPT